MKSLRTFISIVFICTSLALSWFANKTSAQGSQKDQPPVEKLEVDQEQQSDEAAEIDAATVKLFAVPENASVEELLQYIAKAKRLLPKKSPPPARMMQIRINSVLQACDLVIASKPDFELEKQMIEDKLGGLNVMRRYFPEDVETRSSEILSSLEEDTRPEMVRYLESRKLASKARGFSELPDDEREQLLDSLFADIQSVGISRDLLQVLSSEARKLEKPEPETAIKLYNRLADAMEKSESAAMVRRAKKMRGIVRRMSLPGSIMKVVGTTTEGEEFDLETYRGQVVLIDFWASWCRPCIKEIPNVKKQLERYGDKGFTVVGVNLDKELTRCQQSVEQEEITWINLISDDPQQLGWDSPIAVHFGISAIPTAILVDKDGRVVSMRARGEALDRLLGELLGPVESVEDEMEDAKDEPAAAAEQASGKKDNGAP